MNPWSYQVKSACETYETQRRQIDKLFDMKI